jgi:hypothetical protein
MVISYVNNFIFMPFLWAFLFNNHCLDKTKDSIYRIDKCELLDFRVK